MLLGEITSRILLGSTEVDSKMAEGVEFAGLVEGVEETVEVEGTAGVGVDIVEVVIETAEDVVGRAGVGVGRAGVGVGRAGVGVGTAGVVVETTEIEVDVLLEGVILEEGKDMPFFFPLVDGGITSPLRSCFAKCFFKFPLRCKERCRVCAQVYCSLSEERTKQHTK